MSVRLSTTRRTNEDWLAELRGQRGLGQQENAHRDLARYFYVVAYNYLSRRQHKPAILAAFAPEELSALAQDFVQDALLKLASNDFALLQQFRGEGAFTSWCARLLCNLAARELNRPLWRRRDEEVQETDLISPRTPEQTAQIEYIATEIQRCLEQLPERKRLAFEWCIIQNRPGDEVARQLATSSNGVYQLVFRTRRDLRLCLERRGIGPEALALFDE